jgi:RND family efflux transporter MFP subunit
MRDAARNLGSTLALLFVALGCESGNEFVPPPPPAVTVSPPSQRDVTVFASFPGRVEAVDTVDLRARVRGYLRAIRFVEGARVQQGDLLFEIEDEPFEAAVKGAEAALEKARSELELADVTLDRRRKAYETKAISEIDYLIAQAEKKGAEASVLSAEAQLQQTELDLSYTKIHAPVSGRVSRYYVSVGNLVGGAEATLLATIVVDNPVRVLFTVDERTLIPYLTDSGRVGSPGANLPSVFLQLADGSRYPDEGKVDYADPEFDPETGTILVRAVFSNPKATLVPGMYADVLIPDVRENALLVPDLTLQRDLAGTYVLVVDGASQVDSQYVTPGPRVGAERIIEEGLDPRDRVIVRGIQRARPGITVKAETAEGRPREGDSSGGGGEEKSADRDE